MSYDVYVGPEGDRSAVFDSSITYNVAAMIRRAGIHPNVMNGLHANRARQVIDNAYWVMYDNASYFKGWEHPGEPSQGSYDNTLTWVRSLLDFLNEAPDDYVVRWL